jgi:hypothetical protein
MRSISTWILQVEPSPLHKAPLPERFKQRSQKLQVKNLVSWKHSC